MLRPTLSDTFWVRLPWVSTSIRWGRFQKAQIVGTSAFWNWAHRMNGNKWIDEWYERRWVKWRNGCNERNEWSERNEKNQCMTWMERMNECTKWKHERMNGWHERQHAPANEMNTNEMNAWNGMKRTLYEWRHAMHEMHEWLDWMATLIVRIRVVVVLRRNSKTIAVNVLHSHDAARR